MRFQKYTIFLTILILLTFNGCTSSEAPITNTAANTNANIAKNTVENPLATEKTPALETVNTAGTIAPVVQAYCDAIRKKDNAALRNVYSQKALKELEADAKADNASTLVEYLSSEPVGDKCEVRNEKIEGDKAVAEVRTETYPNGIRMYFVKENGVWKMTNESPDIQPVKEGSNTSK
ncbi:MAG TPA: hypothetical protein VK892_05465 [Pyrinomonadaceae bacterium]|nr:hypothetical protein [Pyrinomonadaceae bacterium]